MKSYKDRTSNWNGRQFQHMSEITIHSVALLILYCPKTKVDKIPVTHFISVCFEHPENWINGVKQSCKLSNDNTYGSGITTNNFK